MLMKCLNIEIERIELPPRREERDVDQHAAGAGRLHERTVLHAQTGGQVRRRTNLDRR